MSTIKRFRVMTSRAVAVLVLASVAGFAAPTISAEAKAGTRPGQRKASAAAKAAGIPAATAKLPAPPRPPALRPAQLVLGKSSGAAAPAGTLAATTTAAATAAAGGRSGTGVPGSPGARTLILYDSTGDYGWLGEAYGTFTANLASRFGSWTAHPVASYTAGELSRYTAVVYMGSTYDEPLPVAFLDDVLAASTPVVWAYDNIWQLVARQADFATARGFQLRQFDLASVAEVRYRGTSLTRDASNAAGIMDTAITDPSRASVLGESVRADGSGFPWAVRSGNLTYVGEIPFAYMTHDDRYLAFCDLMFDALAPGTPTRHQALVRLEDVGPDSDPATLRAVADYLYSQRIPFTVAVYPRYRDPNGVTSEGKPQDFTLRDRPKVVSALKYLRSRGGTLLMHGYTHQYSDVSNPYDAVSGNDFEFYSAHVDETDRVIYDGPVPSDSAAWASARVTAGSLEFRLAGLPQPTMFEFPHYAGSAVDYQVVASRFDTRYDRGLYFPGALTGAAPDYGRMFGQFFPYQVRDVYGTAVVPENIGNVELAAYNTHPARLPADLIASARRNLAVRDGYASFFYHPFLGTDYLKQVVDGVRDLGYTFVPAAEAFSR